MVEFARDYLAGVYKLASEAMCTQVTFAGEAVRAGYQSLVELQAEPYEAQASAKVKKIVAGGDFAEAQERSPEEVENVEATMETTVTPARARRKSRPKKD